MEQSTTSASPSYPSGVEQPVKPTYPSLPEAPRPEWYGVNLPGLQQEERDRRQKEWEKALAQYNSEKTEIFNRYNELIANYNVRQENYQWQIDNPPEIRMITERSLPVITRGPSRNIANTPSTFFSTTVPNQGFTTTADTGTGYNPATHELVRISEPSKYNYKNAPTYGTPLVTSQEASRMSGAVYPYWEVIGKSFYAGAQEGILASQVQFDPVKVFLRIPKDVVQTTWTQIGSYKKANEANIITRDFIANPESFSKEPGYLSIKSEEGTTYSLNMAEYKPELMNVDYLTQAGRKYADVKYYESTKGERAYAYIAGLAGGVFRAGYGFAQGTNDLYREFQAGGYGFRTSKDASNFPRITKSVPFSTDMRSQQLMSYPTLPGLKSPTNIGMYGAEVGMIAPMVIGGIQEVRQLSKLEGIGWFKATGRVGAQAIEPLGDLSPISAMGRPVIGTRYWKGNLAKDIQIGKASPVATEQGVLNMPSKDLVTLSRGRIYGKQTISGKLIIAEENMPNLWTGIDTRVTSTTLFNRQWITPTIETGAYRTDTGFKAASKGTRYIWNAQDYPIMTRTGLSKKTFYSQEMQAVSDYTAGKTATIGEYPYTLSYSPYTKFQTISQSTGKILPGRPSLAKGVSFSAQTIEAPFKDVTLFGGTGTSRLKNTQGLSKVNYDYVYFKPSKPYLDITYTGKGVTSGGGSSNLFTVTRIKSSKPFATTAEVQGLSKPLAFVSEQKGQLTLTPSPVKTFAGVQELQSKTLLKPVAFTALTSKSASASAYKVTPTSQNRMLTRLDSRTLLSPATSTITRQTPGQMNKLTPVTATITTPIVTTPLINTPTTYTPPFVPPLAPLSPYIPFAIPFIPGGDFSFGGANIIRRGKRRSKYTPSFEALVFNIKGKAPKGIETGARIRPIPKGYTFAFKPSPIKFGNFASFQLGTKRKRRKK